MLTESEWAQVEQATDAYCTLLKIQGDGERRLVRNEMMLAFYSRKQLNLKNGQVALLAKLDYATLSDVLNQFPRIE